MKSKAEACYSCRVVWKKEDMFHCECGYYECPKCWFKRTDGFSEEELATPFWICPRCRMKVILDHDGNHLTTLGGR